MAGIIGVKAEDMESVDALRRLRPDFPHGFPLVRPHVRAPILVQDDDGALEARLARFGFSRRFSSFNARDDKLSSGRLWSRMFGSSHAIAPVSYVVEWLTEDGKKQPYLVQRADGRPMMAPALVGAYMENKEESAFAICTREPNGFFRRFHGRMIGQCGDAGVRAWLSPQDRSPEELLACVAAPGEDELVAVPADPALSKREKGDWSAIKTVGKPLTSRSFEP